VITANAVLTRWNGLNEEMAAAKILPCCGSTRWAREMAQGRPFTDESELFSHSDAVWLNLASSDWQEAFHSHPRIGERRVAKTATQQSAEWSRQEQDQVEVSIPEIQAALARCNRLYEERFGRIFLICASGKSATEILVSLERRLQSDEQTEWREAVEQQRQITQLRLRKWLHT